MILAVHVNREDGLTQIVDAGDTLGLLFGTPESRQQQGGHDATADDQNSDRRQRDDRDFLITVGGLVLMNSMANRSEVVLGQLLTPPVVSSNILPS